MFTIVTSNEMEVSNDFLSTIQRYLITSHSRMEAEVFQYAFDCGE